MVDDSLIAPWERLAASRKEMAEAEGISVRTLQRRLKAQREAAGATELPWVTLVDHPVPGSHYRTDHDQASVLPPGLFLIGNHHGRRLMVGHAGDGSPVEQPSESKHKFKPKAPRKKRRTG